MRQLYLGRALSFDWDFSIKPKINPSRLFLVADKPNFYSLSDVEMRRCLDPNQIAQKFVRNDRDLDAKCLIPVPFEINISAVCFVGRSKTAITFDLVAV